jgi:hypothetical protein
MLQCLAAFLLGGVCWGQSVPAKPSALDLRLKSAYVSFLKARADRDPAAKEIAAFYAAHPEVDMRFPDAEQFRSSYAGPGTPPLELIRAFYDPRLEVIVIPRTGELSGISVETLPAGAALDGLLKIRANDILHESFHARLDKKFGFKVVNVMEDELLANWKEAQFLSKEEPVSADLARAADEQLRLDEVKSAGLPPEKLAAVERREQELAEKLGVDELDEAVKIARLKRGPAYFKRSILALYGGAGQGKPSIFTPRAAMEAALRRELDRPDLPQASKDILLVQLSLWTRPERLDKVRDYFRKAIPELIP